MSDEDIEIWDGLNFISRSDCNVIQVRNYQFFNYRRKNAIEWWPWNPYLRLWQQEKTGMNAQLA